MSVREFQWRRAGPEGLPAGVEMRTLHVRAPGKAWQPSGWSVARGPREDGGPGAWSVCPPGTEIAPPPAHATEEEAKAEAERLWVLDHGPEITALALGSREDARAAVLSAAQALGALH